MEHIKEPTLFLFKKLWEFSKWNRINVVIFLLFFVLSNLVGLLEPLILATIINEIQQNWLTNNNFSYISLILFSWIWISLTFWLFHWIWRILEKKNAFLVRYNYQTFLINKVLKFNLSWHNNRQSWNTIDKINKSTASLFTFSKRTFSVISIIIKIVWITIALSFFNVWISIWALIMVSIILYIISTFDKKLIVQYKEINNVQNKISAKIYDVLSNITSVIILNINKLVYKDISNNILSEEDIYNKNTILIEKKWFVWDILFQFILVLPLFFYLWINIDNINWIEIWTITALYMYLSKLMNVFFWFSDIYWELIKQKTDIQNAEEIEYHSWEAITRENKISHFKSINIKKLYFSYWNNLEKNVLKDINFEFKKSEKIAFIWKSGSWKTTFLKILHWLYSQEKWGIFIDEIDKNKSLQKINIWSILIPQEPELFTHSIKENITFWMDVSHKKINNFIKLACFNETLAWLPNWLESKINERWVNLSWWEKQRLALARGLLFSEKKNLILLDESTSSVDPKNEDKIYKNIVSIFKDKTVIASIHKLNLLKFFDRIVIFDNWKIIDDWTFEFLLENNKFFNKMWKDFIRKEK